MKKGSAKPNGNLPLMCRLTVDGEIKQFSCKMDVPPHLWDVKNNRASGKSAEAQRINRAVDKIRVEVNRRYQELMQTDGYVTATKLKDAYLGIGVKQETLLKLFEQHNAEFAKKVGHSRAKGTFTRYQTVCKHIREFLPHAYKREDIPLKRGDVLIADMIGLPVIDVETARVYGTLREVNDGVQGKLYTIETKTGDVIFPGIPEFVKEIDVERGVFIRTIPGFFADDEI